MNYEQTLKLPTTRREFFVDTFSTKRLVYAEGLGVFGYARFKGKVYPPMSGTTNTLVGDDYSAITFIYAPTNKYFQEKVMIDASLEIVRFDFQEAMNRYKPNTGLSVAKDKNGLVVLLLNYRKETDGREKISFLGVNKRFAEKEIDSLVPYCTVAVDEITGVTKVSPLV